MAEGPGGEARVARGPLDRLEPLVGEWEGTAIVGGRAVATSRTTFEWIEDGAFLRQHADADPPDQRTPREWIENLPFPITVIIAVDDRSGEFVYAYSDGRGVHRVYRMTFEDGVWRFWGQAGPEFFQRFEGVLGDDGNAIDGRIESSRDGESWELDFEQSYRRVG